MGAKCCLGSSQTNSPIQVSLSGGSPLHGITHEPLGASDRVKCHPWSMDGPSHPPLAAPKHPCLKIARLPKLRQVWHISPSQVLQMIYRRGRLRRFSSGWRLKRILTKEENWRFFLPFPNSILAPAAASLFSLPAKSRLVFIVNSCCWVVSDRIERGREC